jgi:hypothetical protein
MPVWTENSDEWRQSIPWPGSACLTASMRWLPPGSLAPTTAVTAPSRSR